MSGLMMGASLVFLILSIVDMVYINHKENSEYQKLKRKFARLEGEHDKTLKILKRFEDNGFID